jgi:hypothetical protein
MNQTLHIFRKDTRRFWPEVLISTALMFAFAWVYSQRFLSTDGHDMARYNRMQAVVVLLIVLVPASWWLLVARVVQAESLVGDRQYWLTRPYEWPKLLGAKALFVAVWIYGPLVAAQSLLLVRAGFSPMTHPVGWFWMLLLDGGITILPLFAMATLTPNFARMTLVVLGVVLVSIAYTMMGAFWSGYESTVPYSHLALMPAILATVCAVAIALQYATRRLWPSVVLLGLGMLVAFVCVPALFGMKQAVISRDFASTDAGGVQLAFAPDDKHPVKYEPSERETKAYLVIPVQISGVPEGTAIETEDVKFTIEAPDGSRFTAPWWTYEKRWEVAGTHRDNVHIMLPRDVYDRYRNTPVTLHLTLALMRLRAGWSRTVTVEDKAFAVPGFGVCDIHLLFMDHGLGCQAALGDPPLNFVATTMLARPCSGPQGNPAEAARLTGWVGSATQDPVRFGAVAVTALYARLNVRNPDGSEVAHERGLELCPGVPITFTQYDVERRMQASVTIPDFRLPEEPKK